eukprot:3068975-Amphidinium_carterae.1
MHVQGRVFGYVSYWLKVQTNIALHLNWVELKMLRHGVELGPLICDSGFSRTQVCRALDGSYL